MAGIDDLRYSKDHLWVRQENELTKVGITDHAQKELGELLYIELPEIGSRITKAKSFATIESAKVVTDVIAPLDGEITQINDQLNDHPEIVNNDPYDKGWFVIIKADNADDINNLLNYNDYTAYLKE